MGKKKDILKELEGETPEVEAIPEESVDAEPEKDIPKAPETFAGVVACGMLNVRALPDKTSRIVTVLSKGTEVAGLTETDDPAWYAYTGFGYVMAEFIKRK